MSKARQRREQKIRDGLKSKRKISRDFDPQAEQFEFHVSFSTEGEDPQKMGQRLADLADKAHEQAAFDALMNESIAVTFWNGHWWRSLCGFCDWQRDNVQLRTAMDDVAAHTQRAMLTLHLLDMKAPGWVSHVEDDDLPPGTTIN